MVCHVSEIADCNLNHLKILVKVPDGRCFLAAWAVSKSIIAFKHDRPKPNLPKRKVSTHSDVQCGTADRPRFFSGRANSWKKCPF